MNGLDVFLEVAYTLISSFLIIFGLIYWAFSKTSKKYKMMMTKAELEETLSKAQQEQMIHEAKRLKIRNKTNASLRPTASKPRKAHSKQVKIQELASLINYLSNQDAFGSELRSDLISENFDSEEIKVERQISKKSVKSLSRGDQLKQAVIWSEILQPPVSKRR